MTAPKEQVGCRDECGRAVPADAIESSGWTFLPIKKRWRSPECARALERRNAKDMA